MKNKILSFMGLKGSEMDKAEFNREKDYKWKKISEITSEMDKKANAEELHKLEMTIPESLKDATQASRRTSEFRNRAKEAKEEAEKAKGLIDQFKADSESAFSRVIDIDLQASNIHDNLKALLKDATLKHNGLAIAYDESTEVIDKIKEIIQEHDELVNTVESIQEYKKIVNQIMER
ncbi:hypothetical protein [Aeromonas veronii]|uniref:hypothetical protein n=1 Tax=Aeromonas veronii TaxID=654 RepID=UPI003F74811E